MTMTGVLQSQIICQKSATVSGVGPAIVERESDLCVLCAAFTSLGVLKVFVYIRDIYVYTEYIYCACILTL